MCACSMGLIISRPCRQNRWCQSCVRGWLLHWDHNRSSWNHPVELSLTGWFHDDLLARPLKKSEKPGGLWDRQGNHWVVFDVDGSASLRQRTLRQQWRVLAASAATHA